MIRSEGKEAFQQDYAFGQNASAHKAAGLLAALGSAEVRGFAGPQM